MIECPEVSRIPRSSVGVIIFLIKTEFVVNNRRNILPMCNLSHIPMKRCQILVIPSPRRPFHFNFQYDHSKTLTSLFIQFWSEMSNYFWNHSICHRPGSDITVCCAFTFNRMQGGDLLSRRVSLFSVVSNSERKKLGPTLYFIFLLYKSIQSSISISRNFMFPIVAIKGRQHMALQHQCS